MLFLIMQFLWKYMDDIMGKGIEMFVILKLLFYTSANLIPFALPIAILFSSIMTMGNLAESNELTSMKSSGMSLLKVMRPLVFIMVLISAFAFYFSNYILPIANLKQRTIIYDVQEKKSTFALTEGVFYNDIEGYSIKVDKKNDDTGEVLGVLIYQSKGTQRIISAKKGELIKSDDDRFLFLKLYDGSMYEQGDAKLNKKMKFPFTKSFFESSIVKFDISDFGLQNSDEELFKRDYEMMNFIQLGHSMDSINVINDSLLNVYKSSAITQNVIYDQARFKPLEIDTNIQAKNIEPLQKVEIIFFVDSLPDNQLRATYKTAQSKLRAKKDYIQHNTQLNQFRAKALNEYKTEWHRKFTLAFSIIILFFVGAPLGAIVKKGGLGAPMVMAVVLFLVYYILTISGESMIESNMISPFWGMWLSSFILSPLAMFLTYQAANDSALFDKDAYLKVFNALYRILVRKRIVKT